MVYRNVGVTSRTELAAHITASPLEQIHRFERLFVNEPRAIVERRCRRFS